MKQLQTNRFTIFIRNFYKKDRKILIKKDYRRIQADIKKMQILRKQHLSKCEYFVSMQKTDHPKNNEVLAPYTLNSILQHYFPEINFKNDI